MQYDKTNITSKLTNNCDNKDSVISINNLTVQYGSCCTTRALAGVSMNLVRGGNIGIIGESGSGKSTLALTIMRLLSPNAKISGNIIYTPSNIEVTKIEADIDLLKIEEKRINKLRWNKIAIAFQNALDTLNPVLSVFDQLLEVVNKHLNLKGQSALQHVDKYLHLVGLPQQFFHAYPHQLSGGLRQRVLIAMAICCEPEVLIIDEPTTALDALSKIEIVNLIKKLHAEQKFTLVVISHEFHVISSLTNYLYVMYAGKVIEKGYTKEIMKKPIHPYTRGLLYASPTINPYRDLWGIPSEFIPHHHHGCSFYGRCNQRLDSCNLSQPNLETVTVERQVACHRDGIVKILQVSNIVKHYEQIHACNDCSFELYAGEVTAIIGQSGSGKTTLASIVAGILPADRGSVRYLEDTFTGNKYTAQYGGIQMVFQDPFSAINENLTVAEAISEPLVIQQKLHKKDSTIRKINSEEIVMLVTEKISLVQLPVDACFADRRCYSLSGGQRQRVAIARALIMEPKLLIADEINSMLDPSTQANILRLLKGLQNSSGFTMLYITHDLMIAKKIADHVIVMNKGEIVEVGNTAELFEHPQHAYTQELLSAIGIS